MERHFSIIAFHVSTFANCPLCHSTKEKPPRSLLPRGRLLVDRFLPPILTTTSRQTESPYLRGPSFPSPPPSQHWNCTLLLEITKEKNNHTHSLSTGLAHYVIWARRKEKKRKRMGRSFRFATARNCTCSLSPFWCLCALWGVASASCN